MKSSEVLKSARELISVPERWIQGEMAKDSFNNHLAEGNHPNAVCWCSVGAIQKVLDVEHSASVANDFLLKAINYDDNGSYYYVSSFNDSHSHQEVLDAFDAAIVLAESEND